jgi:hypothetical protein
VIFILIISFMPEGLVPGSVRLWRTGVRRLRGSQSPSLDRTSAAGPVGRLIPWLRPERTP